jgi:sugar phosphate isomerase/epimerase
MADVDILASCWTTAGDAFPMPGRLLSPLALVDRIEESSRVGFTGFGILDNDLEAFLATSDLKTLRRILDDNGMRWVELELLTNWWKADSTRPESDRVRRLLLEAAEVLGADHIKVVADTENLAPPDPDQWIPEFIKLSDEAAEHGTTIALEFLPFTNVPNLAAAVDLVSLAGHPAGGICVDLWHVERSRTPIQDLAAVPLGLIKAVELDDATLAQVGDEYEDTVFRRRMLGEGEFRVTEFIRVVAGLGWPGPWGVELISEVHRMRPLEQSLPDVVRTTRAAFAAAGI